MEDNSIIVQLNRRIDAEYRKINPDQSLIDLLNVVIYEFEQMVGEDTTETGEIQDTR
jgi:hypothetical protein